MHPLYTWILVALPKAPQTTEKPWAKALEEKISEGMRLAMDSIKLAKTIAVGRIVNSIAFETEEESNLVY